ncbi:hypothetical protein SLS62_001149 [Diatrype stigma]|uniref:Uncharacterized protein n=1 Tax=Diatrype stigma TaxID=117547 RepID=A0AAN9YRX8_9PEZI
MGLTYVESTTTHLFSPHLHTGVLPQQKLATSGFTGDMSSPAAAATTPGAGNIKAPILHEILGPLLPALLAASVSATPAETVLPLLSPILRQRVQLLSTNDSEPWIDLLCYDKANVPRLREIAQSDRLELHPVSGEVEVDWDYDAEIRYRRVDEETLQALVVLRDMGLSFQLIYCTGDPVNGEGWRIGEVGVVAKPSPFSSFGGVSTIAEAERQFVEKKQQKERTATIAAAVAPAVTSGLSSSSRHLAVGGGPDMDEDDDDDYWAQYDATPSRTPAMPRSPAPQQQTSNGFGGSSTGLEEDYYSQYDTVQPTMDNYDPDEDANPSSANVNGNGNSNGSNMVSVEQEVVPAPPLGLARPVETGTTAKVYVNGNDASEAAESNETQGSWTLAEPVAQSPSPPAARNGGAVADLVHPHPRPASAASSRASVERLEAAAEKRDQSEFGVKQHVSRSIKSLYMLSRASGIDRQEFERLVRTELDMLGLMDEGDDMDG